MLLCTAINQQGPDILFTAHKVCEMSLCGGLCLSEYVCSSGLHDTNKEVTETRHSKDGLKRRNGDRSHWRPAEQREMYVILQSARREIVMTLLLQNVRRFPLYFFFFFFLRCLQ